jgi:hypothetical protein
MIDWSKCIGSRTLMAVVVYIAGPVSETEVERDGGTSFLVGNFKIKKDILFIGAQQLQRKVSRTNFILRLGILNLSLSVDRTAVNQAISVKTPGKQGFGGEEQVAVGMLTVTVDGVVLVTVHISIVDSFPGLRSIVPILHVEISIGNTNLTNLQVQR